jgi:phenylacetate-CoA ligase
MTLRGRFLRALAARKAFTPARMAAYAKRHTAFYAEFYRDHDPADFASLPVLRKHLVKERDPYDLLARPLRDKVVYYGETTGSTGSPTPAFYTAKEFRGATLLTLISPWCTLLREVLRENRTVLNGLAFGFTVAGMSFGDLLKNVGALVANTGCRSTLATPPRIARGIARLRPSIVAATPIDFLSWMRVLREDFPGAEPEARGKLRALLMTAELCGEERVKRLAEHFGIVVIDVYACVEGFFSLPCPCGEKHVLPAYHAELFDDDLGCIGTEGTGRFAFTNLLKRSTPMVRYLLDDLVTISASQCPFGFRKSIVVHGRHELTVRIRGEKVNVRHFENVIFAHGLFGDFRAVIHEDGMAVTLEDYAAPAGAAEKVARALTSRFGMPAEVDLVPFGTITDYREPRKSKPILKVEDRRRASTQEPPSLL